ncbi:NAD-dependent epimerase/dehydratase family protein [Bacillus testis]|uniref:NAD-dependent epimerase/dehydratase family protein n=1 Tax=Bacillus testis TaxID=1622072 RepID=UPI00067EBBA0|nr:NAD-dependent epimerase/dehydratase family protein [Bacillus testis]
MGKVLVLGGTRFFGKELVHQLIKQQYDVTVATRGKTADRFGPAVKRLIVNRRDPESMKHCLQQDDFDIVYDNIGYNDQEAAYLCRALTPSVKKLIFTSSMAVYESGQKIKENAFSPSDYDWDSNEEADYGEGKRRAEAYYFQNAPTDVTAVRFPIVLGEDDYTGRLLYYGEQIIKGEKIKPASGEMCFISSKEAGRFLVWCADKEKLGAINASSDGTIDLQEIMDYYGRQSSVPVQFAEDGKQGPYDAYSSYTLSNQKAKGQGFLFSQLRDYLYPLMDLNLRRLDHIE